MKKVLLGLLVLILLAAVVARAMLPGVAKRKMNRKLAAMEGYKGSVENVEIALIRGGFAIVGLELEDKKGDMTLKVPRLFADVSWKAALKKVVVVDATIYEPRVTMVAAKPTEAAKKTGKKVEKAETEIEKKTGKSVGQVLEDMLPFRVGKFKIVDGTIVVRSGSASAKEEEKRPDEERRVPDEPLKLTDVDVVVEDFTNMREDEKAKGVATAELAGGTLKLELDFKPLKDEPTFDLDLAIKKIDLARLNPMLQWQMDQEVEGGVFELVAEVDAAGGGYKGYLKPFLKDLKLKPAKGGVAKKAARAVASVAIKILDNPKTDKVASRVPFQGKFGKAEAGLWEAVVTVLRNAFVEALRPSFEKL